MAAFGSPFFFLGRASSGRLQSSRTMATISEKIARNGKFPPVTGRLVAANIINDLTTGTDPLKTYSQGAERQQ